MTQIFEMVAYIAEALTFNISPSLQNRLTKQLESLQYLIDMDADSILSLDITSCRLPVNELLLETSEYIRNELSSTDFGIKKGKQCRGIDWVGKNLKDKDLRTADLRGAYLIAADLRNADLRGADLIGADLRDANLSGANLTASLFLTQRQLNSAKGDYKTKLPSHWIN